MTPARWLQIKELFNEALACEPAQREEFLAAKCAGDKDLRTEVQSLLSSLEEDEGFIEAPAGDLAAELLGTHRPTYERGHKIHNYLIEHQIGSGGMGEVYLAQDSKLKRRVALKLLPPHFTINPDRVRRFEREARAASALNHPNIVTIYEIGVSESTHFIATEFVDGKTLRQLINEKPLTLNETLSVSLQVAEALNGAHAAGIVHRDIKPENIMIRHDGYVKILDFGLAKLTERQTLEKELETPTLLQTNPGLVMGTVQYMSPEQARAKNVGVGTDIWSLGIVMYELLSGQVPFTGETPSHVMVSLMEDELPPLKNHANVPTELDHFVTKALRKNQRARYQTAGDLARDLKDFKQQLQHDSYLKDWLKTVPSQKEGMPLPPHGSLTTISGAHLVALENRTATETSPLQSYVTATAEYLIREVKSHRTLALAASVIVIFSAIGLTYFFKQRASSTVASQNATTVSASANPTPTRGTNNEEAYRSYSQGRNLMRRGGGGGGKKAIDNFEHAIQLDPNYAEAYAGLAFAYFALASNGVGSPRIENEKAKQAVKKALELDSNLAEAYAVRGLLSLFDEWDFVAAEKDLSKALELEPNNDMAHWARANLYTYTGRFELALKEIETAQGIAPGTSIYERERGKIPYYARRYDEAIVLLKRHVELVPDAGQIWLSRAYEMKGDYPAAFEAFLKTKMDPPRVMDPQRVEAFRATFETAGWQGVTRKFIEFSLLDERNGTVVNIGRTHKLAIAFAQLGEKDQAFVYLNKLVAERAWQVSQLEVDPLLDPLRGDPRFDALLKVIRR